MEGRICIIVQGILILKNTQNISQENTLLDDCPRQMPTSKGFYSPTLVEYSCTNTVRLLPSHLQILLGLAVPFDLLQSMLGWSFVYQFWQGHSDFGLAFFPSSRVCYQCHLVHADCEITWQSRIKHVHNKSLEHNVTFQKKKIQLLLLMRGEKSRLNNTKLVGKQAAEWNVAGSSRGRRCCQPLECKWFDVSPMIMWQLVAPSSVRT